MGYGWDEMKITACPKCGSKNISMGTMDSGVTFGVTSWNSVCRNCGYQGMPLHFDSKQEYNRFLKGLLQKGKASKVPAKDLPQELSEKDQEILELLNELRAEEKIREPKSKEDKEPSKKKNWWFEIGLSIGIASVLFILSLPRACSLYGVTFGVLYCLLVLLVEAIIILFVIVIIEYFYKTIKNVIIRKSG